VENESTQGGLYAQSNNNYGNGVNEL